jgi:hypothetical protein
LIVVVVAVVFFVVIVVLVSLVLLFCVQLDIFSLIFEVGRFLFASMGTLK